MPLPSGLIQFARDNNRKTPLQKAFDNYIQGFINHAYTLRLRCPACGKGPIRAIEMHEETDRVVGTWRCASCEKTAKKTIMKSDLADDFNASRKGQCRKARP